MTLNTKAAMKIYKLLKEAHEEYLKDDDKIDGDDWQYVIEDVEGKIINAIYDVANSSYNYNDSPEFIRDFFLLIGELTAVMREGKIRGVSYESTYNAMKERVKFLSGGDVRVWVNVYHITREYGGAEEGGWYFNWTECQESHNVSISEAEYLKAALTVQYGEGEGNIYSVLGGHQIQIYIEAMKAESQDTERPRYE